LYGFYDFDVILLKFFLFEDFAMDLSHWKWIKSQNPGFYDLNQDFDNK